MLMKMVLCIVHSDDADNVVRAVSQAGFKTTRIASTGGYLGEANCTLVALVEPSQVDEFLDLVHENVHERMLMPNFRRPQVVTTGAVAFVINADQTQVC